jgi:hypothetical protein
MKRRQKANERIFAKNKVIGTRAMPINSKIISVQLHHATLTISKSKK